MSIEGKRAYIILHPQTSGGRMFAQAFVAAGCFGDPGLRVSGDHPLDNLQGHGQRLDVMAATTTQEIPGKDDISADVFETYFGQTLDDAPDVIVWRRSVPHGAMSLAKCVNIYHRAQGTGYQCIVVVPWRTRCDSEAFVQSRGNWDSRAFELVHILEWCRQQSIDPFLVHYDAFVCSPEYRRFVGSALRLPNIAGLEKLTYEHAGLKWGDTRWWKIRLETDFNYEPARGDVANTGTPISLGKSAES